MGKNLEDMMKTLQQIINEIERRENLNKLGPFPHYNREVIEDFKIIKEMISQKKDYDNVPVTYCKTCLSLKVKNIENPNVAYCVDCGNTDLEETHILDWEKLYEAEYGEKFLNTNKDD
tara:strand:+ start:1892 stop:2245 length:354 start_codon:yes stop_codon:yes gene_type:complete